MPSAHWRAPWRSPTPSTERALVTPDLEAVDPDDDARYQQLKDARLLGRKQLVPQRIEPLQGLDDLTLIDRLAVELRCPPDPHDDLGRAQHRANLVNDRRFNLARRHRPDRACVVAQLEAGRGPIESIQPAALPRVAGRMALPSGPMIRPLSSAGAEARVRLARRGAFSARIARTLSQVSGSMMASCAPG
jgi:hypothetical protein